MCREAFYIGGADSLSPPVPLSRSTPIPLLPPPPLAPLPPRYLPRLRHFEDFIMSDESVELETHAEDGGGQVVEVHSGGQAEVMAEGPKAAKKGGRLRGLLRRLSSLSLFPRPQQGQQPRRSLSWRRKRRRKSEGAGKSPSSPLSSFRELWHTSSSRILASNYSDRHPVSREVLKIMLWKVPMAGWPPLWLATAQAEPRNFSQQS